MGRKRQFQIVNDQTVIANIAGAEKLPDELRNWLGGLMTGIMDSLANEW